MPIADDVALDEITKILHLQINTPYGLTDPQAFCQMIELVESTGRSPYAVPVSNRYDEIKLDNPEQIRTFSKEIIASCEAASTPGVVLDVLEAALKKVATVDRRPTWDPYGELFQRFGAECYEQLWRIKEDMTATVGKTKANGGKLTEDEEDRIDRLVNITRQLLINIFDVTEAEIAEGLERFKGEINAP